MARPREREEVVPDRAVVSPPLDRETLFTRFHVIGQRAVGEPEAPDIAVAGAIAVEHVDDATGVEQPEAEERYEDRDRTVRFDRHVRPAQRHPTDVEHLPSPDGIDRTGERALACAELDAIVIDHVPVRRAIARGAAWRVRERRGLLATDERGDVAGGRRAQGEHAAASEKGFDRRFEGVLGRQADVLRANPAVAADDERRRQAEDRTVRGGYVLAAVAVEDRVAHLELP